MSYDVLWAPWRLAYIQGEAPPKPADAAQLPAGAEADCFLCQAAATADDRAHMVVRRGAHCFTILNRYPYNNGHLLVAPLAHRGELADLAGEVHQEMMTTIAHWTTVIRQQMDAEGFNVGLNLGHVAGAGAPGHLHWHIVPRWSGDVNFMPSVAGAKVLPQSLDALWELLTSAK